MARRPRIHYPGAIYHAIVRGNNRQPIFLRDRDRQIFADLVSKGVERFDHRIHAFCWMTNHAHMMIEVGADPLSKIIHNLSFRYSNWFNRHNERSGHLFERRYRAGLIESDRAAMGLVRYIHLNPVRAGIVQSPLQHQWSSHRIYLGMESVSWLRTSFILGLFSDRKFDAILKYRAFTYAGIQAEDQDDSQHEPDQLHSECASTDRPTRIEPEESLFHSADELLLAVCESHRIEARSLVGVSQKGALRRARAVAAFLTRESRHVTLTEMGRELGRDQSTLSRAAERIAKRIREDENLAQSVERVRQVGRDLSRAKGRPI